MSANEPIDPRVRLAIARWPDDAPRGAVTTFCLEHALTRKSFYELRKRARIEGPAAVLEPKSRRPAASPSTLTSKVKKQALQVRAALEASGLDHGPISVHDKMHAMGLEHVPSIASLGRIFRQAGVARLEPKKKPRSAWRRFVYPAPNACWQLDATEYVLTGGRKCMIFQLIDDHSRYAVASHVARAETAKDAIIVFDKAVAVHGVPQRLLSDNGLALNPTRRGYLGQLVEHLRSLGTEPITGKPYKPTTQGKNERFHQTLFRYLDKQPLADTLTVLQTQVDAFDHIYNTQRPHQGLPGRITPQQSWDATAVAEPPRPKVRERAGASPDRSQGSCDLTVTPRGHVSLHGTRWQISQQRANQTIHAVWDEHGIVFADTTGEIILEHRWPSTRQKYVSNGIRRGRPSKTRPSPMS